MAPLDLDNAFWRFSLRIYGAPGVAAECLALQDEHGLDVNILLFAAWLGTEPGRLLDASDLDRVRGGVAGWAQDVVQPLRAVRRRLKTVPEISDPEIQSLRKRVAEAELVSEQIEQAMLYRVADGMGRAAEPGGDVARANVETLLGSRGVDPAAVSLRNLFAVCGGRAASDAPKR
jgi:uncharacterized protein (TIGR02444 family)